jgi:HEAT repeat protein
MRVAAALALHQLGDDTGRVAAIEVLGAGGWFEQQSAISLLGLIGGPDVEDALVRAFEDPDAGVRSAAAGTLVKLHGLEAYGRGYQQRLGQLQNRLSSPLRAVRAVALAELREIFERSKRGETPDQLGLTWRADDQREPFRTLALSMQSSDAPWQDDFPWQLIASLTGVERVWAEDNLWHFLPTDPRAARALARLGVQRAVEPLREVMAMATGALAIEVAAALWQLAGDEAALDQLRDAARGPDAGLAALAGASPTAGTRG